MPRPCEDWLTGNVLPLRPSDASASLLRGLFDQVAALRADVAEVRSLMRGRLREGDQEKFEALVPCAFASYGELEFTADDLDEFAASEGREALREVLAQIGNPRAVGSLLGRCYDAGLRSAGGVALVYVGTEARALVWRLQRK